MPHGESRIEYASPSRFVTFEPSEVRQRSRQCSCGRWPKRRPPSAGMIHGSSSMGRADCGLNDRAQSCDRRTIRIRVPMRRTETPRRSRKIPACREKRSISPIAVSRSMMSSSFGLRHSDFLRTWVFRASTFIPPTVCRRIALGHLGDKPMASPQRRARFAGLAFDCDRSVARRWG